MNKMLRVGQRLALVGVAIAGSVVGLTSRAFALPDADILQKLNPIPVFAIADGQGYPLIASVNDDPKVGETSVTGVFVSQKDAVSFVEQLKKEKPELGSQVQVVLTTLGKIYEFAKTPEAQKTKLSFEFVPTSDELKAAGQIAKAEDPKITEFRGVPLFFASVTNNGKEIYLPHADGKIRLFFDREPLDQQIAAFKQQDQKIASQIKVGVMPLEVLIGLLQDDSLPDQDKELLRKMVLIPSRESMTLIDAIVQQAQANGDKGTPLPNQPQPAANNRPKPATNNTVKPKPPTR